jgi:hypothetical protein
MRNLTNGESYVFTKADNKAVITSGTDNAHVATTTLRSNAAITGDLKIGDAPSGLYNLHISESAGPAMLIEATENAFVRLGVKTNVAEEAYLGWHDDKDFRFGPLAAKNSSAVDTAMTLTSTKNVGIGITNPTEKLEVVGDMSCSVDLHVGDDIFVGGDVGIGNTSPNAKLHVKTDTGNSSDYVAYFQNTRTHRSQSVVRISTSAAGGGGTIPIADNATFIDFWGNNNYQILGAISTGANGWGIAYGSNSDRRLKENITPTVFGLKDLLKLEVCDYNWKADTSSSTLETGLIAQDVGKIYPAAAIIPSEESGRYASIDYGKFAPLLIQAIQDQQKVIDDLQKRITKMENI